jgi:hypothetical protein
MSTTNDQCIGMSNVPVDIDSVAYPCLPSIRRSPSTSVDILEEDTRTRANNASTVDVTRSASTRSVNGRQRQCHSSVLVFSRLASSDGRRATYGVSRKDRLDSNICFDRRCTFHKGNRERREEEHCRKQYQ